MIAARTVRDDWWKVLAYGGILAFNLVMTMIAYPTFEANYRMVINLIPNSLGFVRNVMEQGIEDKFQVFAAINHFFKGANIIGSAAAIILALGTVVREVEIGTIGLLLSRPVSRVRILGGFVVVHLVELIVPLLIVTALIPALADGMLGREIPHRPFLLAAIHGSSFVFLVYAISLFFSVLLSEQSRVAVAAGGICVLSFMLYFIDQTRPFTLFRFSSMELYIGVVSEGPFPWFEFLFCMGTGSALLVAAAAVFRRRDY